MNSVTKAAQALGRLGGRATSEAKAAAVRANGAMPPKPGSRPRGRPKKTPPSRICGLFGGIKRAKARTIEAEPVAVVTEPAPPEPVPKLCPHCGQPMPSNALDAD